MKCCFVAVFLFCLIGVAVQHPMVARKGKYCEGSSTLYGCSHPLKIMLIPQNPPIPSLHGCDKRAFHTVEGLRASGHEVVITPFSTTRGRKSPFDLQLLKSIDAANTTRPMLLYEEPVQAYRYC